MPNVLCESIFCGCIPIATNVGNASFIIGDESLVLKESTNKEFEQILTYARRIPKSERSKIRERAIRLFSIEKRKEKLLAVLEGDKI